MHPRTRQTAEKERQTAEKERQTAEKERQTAEKERQTAEKERQTAERTKRIEQKHRIIAKTEIQTVIQAEPSLKPSTTKKVTASRKEIVCEPRVIVTRSVTSRKNQALSVIETLGQDLHKAVEENKPKQEIREQIDYVVSKVRDSFIDIEISEKKKNAVLELIQNKLQENYLKE